MDTEPFRYPASSADARYAVIALGGAVLLVGIGLRYAITLSPSIVAAVPLVAAVVAACFLSGYLTRVLAVGGDEPPEPTAEMYRQGVRSLVVATGVLSIPAFFVLASLVSVISLEDSAGTAPVIGFALGSTGALALFIATTYVAPVVLVRTTEHPIRTAVFSREIVPVLRETDYLTWWAVGITVFGVGLGLLSVTIRSGEFTGVLAAFIAGYAMLVGTRALRRGYESALEP